MSSADLWEDGYPHGTVEGYDNGCRGGACPADAEIGMSCKRAKALAAGDFRYNRLVAAGKSPAEIAATIDGRDVAADPPARKPAQTSKAKAKPPADVEEVAPITETPAEVSIAGPPTTATPSAGPTEPTESTTPTPEEDAMPEAPLTTEKFTVGLNQRGRTFVLRSIREWARTNGFPGVPSHGRIPQDALAAFDRAHPTGIIGAEASKPEAGVDAHVEQLRTIRVWAQENGYPGVTNLTVTPEIRQAYAAAHAAPETVAPAEPDNDVPALPTLPEAGMRAWVRHDDGIAVVREVERSLDGTATAVRVTFLPNVRDNETWASIDWLDTISELLPIDVFTYDHFPREDNDGVASQLAQWEQEGRSYRERPRPFLADIGDLRDRAGLAAIDEAILDPHDMTEPTRPEWGEVAVSADVENARSLAIRLEAENALLIEQVAVAHKAVEITLRLHAQLSDENQLLRAQLQSMTDLARRRGAHIAFDRSTARLTKMRIEELEQTIADLQEDLNAARTPWWKRPAR